MSCVHRYLQMSLQCETLFENHRCQGVKGHDGCCQDIDFDGCNGEQYTYINGKNWCELQLSNQSVIEGDNMAKVQKATIGGIPYLDKKTVLEKGVKKVKIETEAELVDTEFEGKKSRKLECICSTQVLDPTRVTWQMNNTTMNFLIDKFGDDTKTWIGKEIEIAVKQAGSSSPGVYPKDCSLEKVY